MNRWFWPLFVATISSLGIAEHAFVKKAHTIIVASHKDTELLKDPKTDRAALLKRAEDRLAEIDALDEEFKNAMSASIDALNTSDSHKLLERLRQKIDAAVQGSKESEPMPLLQKDEEQGLHFRKINPSVSTLIRSKINVEQLEVPVRIFELAAFHLRLQESYLKNLDIKKVTKERHPHLTWDEYQHAYLYLQNAVAILQMLFPEFPDPSNNQLIAKTKADTVGDRLSKTQLQHVAQLFLPISKRMSKSHAARIQNAFHVIAHGVSMVEGYKRRFFPRRGNGDELEFISNTIFQVPGAESCLGLVRGMANFRTAPCDLLAFRGALSNYIETAQKIHSHGVMTHAMQLLQRFFAGNYGRGEEAMERLKTKFLNLGDSEALADVNPNIQKVYPKLIEMIFADEPPKNAPRNAKTLKQLLELEDPPSPIVLFHFLKPMFLRVGIGVFRDGDKGFREAGTIKDMKPDVAAAQALQKGFNDRIEGFLSNDKFTNLTGTPDERLVHVSERMGYLNASPNSCALFQEDKKSEAKKLTDRKDAPWVVYSDGVDIEEGASARRSEANFVRKQTWLHDAKLGNAITIQETRVVAESRLAGLILQTVTQSIVPSMVQTQMLLNHGDWDGENLGDLGIKDSNAPDLQILRDREGKYRLPHPEEMIAYTKHGYEEFLRPFALRTGMIKPAKDSTPEALEKEFQANKTRIGRARTALHRQRMHNAAKAIRDFHGTLDEFDVNYILPADTPSATKALFGQLAANRIEGFDDDKETAVKRGVLNAKIAYMVDSVRWEWLRANKMPLNSILTVEQFLEAFQHYGKKYVQGDLYHNLYWKNDGKGNYAHRNTLIKIYEHGINTYQLRKEYLQYAIDTLIRMFPYLEINQNWKTFDGTERDYRRVLNEHLKESGRQLNWYLNLGRNKSETLPRTRAILKGTVRILPLMETTLRTHPQFKAALCTAQSRMDWSERVTNYVLDGVSYASAGAVLVPPLAPIAGPTYAASMAAQAGLGFYRSIKRYNDTVAARNFTRVAGPQIEAHSMDYSREMNLAISSQVLISVMHTAFAAMPLAGRSVRQAVGQTTKEAFKSAAKGAAHQTRFAFREGLRQLPKRLHHALSVPAREMGIAATRKSLKGAAPTFLQRMTKPFFKTPWNLKNVWHRAIFTALRGTGRVALHTIQTLRALPVWAMTGTTRTFWANTWRARILEGTIDSIAIYALAMNYRHGYLSEAIDMMMKTFDEFPNAYKDWEMARQGGRISEEEFFVMMDMDTRLGKVKRDAFEAKAMELKMALFESDDPAEIDDLKHNLELMGRELQELVEKSRAKGVNHPEYLMWARVYEQYERAAKQVELFDQ